MKDKRFCDLTDEACTEHCDDYGACGDCLVAVNDELVYDEESRRGLWRRRGEMFKVRRRGIRKVDLAEYIGVSVNAIERIERGEPTRLARILEHELNNYIRERDR